MNNYSSRTQEQETSTLVIYINGREYQPTKKVVNKRDLLELVEINSIDCQIFLLEDGPGKYEIKDDTGLELKAGMRFLIQ
jgi:hypothetical protein